GTPRAAAARLSPAEAMAACRTATAPATSAVEEAVATVVVAQAVLGRARRAEEAEEEEEATRAIPTASSATPKPATAKLPRGRRFPNTRVATWGKAATSARMAKTGM